MRSSLCGKKFNHKAQSTFTKDTKYVHLGNLAF